MQFALTHAITSPESRAQSARAPAVRGAHASRSCGAALGTGAAHHADGAAHGRTTADGGQPSGGEHDRAAAERGEEVSVSRLRLSFYFWVTRLTYVELVFMRGAQLGFERAGRPIAGAGQRGDALREPASTSGARTACGARESDVARGVGGAAVVRALNGEKCNRFNKFARYVTVVFFVFG